MDVAVHKVLTDIENSFENPQHTKEGQLVVSPSDTFWTRLAKEGEQVSGYAQNGTVNDVLTGPILIAPGIGRRLYVSRIYASSSIPARVTITISTVGHGRIYQPSNSIPTTYYETLFVPAYQPVILTYNGDLWLKEKSSLKVSFQALTSGQTGVYDCTAMGWEVAVNA